MTNAPTLADIAAATGFSINTISLALRNSPRISEQTKLYIQETAQKMHYVPNNLARSLVKQTSKTVGVIVRNFENPLFVEIVRQIESNLREAGYLMIAIAANGDGIREAEMLVSQRVSGLLVYPRYNERTIPFYEDLRSKNVPLVMLSGYDQISSLDMVYVDQRQGAYMATKYLLGLGHTRIGIIHASGSKLTGYQQAMTEAGIVPDPSWFFSERLSDYELGTRSAKPMLDAKVTAVFATTDRIAMGFMRYCREQHVRIPQDISLIGYDNNEECDYLEVPLTTIEYDVGRVGQNAVDILFQRMGKDLNEVEPVKIQVKASVKERESCRPLEGSFSI